jgi:hypothetical protein
LLALYLLTGHHEIWILDEGSEAGLAEKIRKRRVGGHIVNHRKEDENEKSVDNNRDELDEISRRKMCVPSEIRIDTVTFDKSDTTRPVLQMSQ